MGIPHRRRYRDPGHTGHGMARPHGRLARKLADELAPDSLVLSSTFALPGWEPQRVRQAADLYRTRIYTYRPPRLQATQEETT